MCYTIAMKTLKVDRQKVYPQGGNFRFAWHWHYHTEPFGKTSHGADKRLENTSLVELRRIAKRKGFALEEKF